MTISVYNFHDSGKGTRKTLNKSRKGLERSEDWVIKIVDGSKPEVYCKTCLGKFSREDAVKRHLRNKCTGEVFQRRGRVFCPAIFGPDGLAILSKTMGNTGRAPVTE